MWRGACGGGGGGFAHAVCCKWSHERVCWQVCTLAGVPSSVSSVAFSSDGKLVVSGSYDRLVKIWDSGTGTEVSSVVRARCGVGVMAVLLRGFNGCFVLEATGVEVQSFM